MRREQLYSGLWWVYLYFDNAPKSGTAYHALLAKSEAASN